MESTNKDYWNLIKRLFLYGTILLVSFIIFKFIIYFMPFFIAGVLALIVEPIIKFLMDKAKLSRRVSSSIVIFLAIFIIVLLTMSGGIFIVSKIVGLSKELGPIISEFSNSFETELSEISDKLLKYIPKEALDMVTDSIKSALSNAGIYIQELLGKVMEFILSVPTIVLNVIVTILALIFFTKDRIYIIDMLENHVPKKWIKKVFAVLNDIFATLKCYATVYGKILIVTFSELFLSFAILKAIGFELNNIVFLAFIIAIVDILPVLGVGTVLIPWIIWEFTVGNTNLAVALGIVYIIILIIRQLIEPKLVSKQFGVHPLITLFAMYAGFKCLGFSGLIFGPIILIILGTFLEKNRKT